MSTTARTAGTSTPSTPPVELRRRRGGCHYLERMGFFGNKGRLPLQSDYCQTSLGFRCRLDPRKETTR